MSNHQKIRDTIKDADVLLSRKKNSPISEAISGITRAHWSHAFIYLGEGKILESDWDGVIIRPLEFYLNNEYDVGLFRVTPVISEEDTAVVVTAARKLLGIHYGFWQILWQFILRICGKSEDPDYALDVDKGMICTEVVATAYQEIGIQFKDLPPHQMEPADFDDSPITVRIA